MINTKPMLKISSILLLLWLPVITYGQTLFDFPNDRGYKTENPKLIRLIKERLIKNADFELRFWHFNGNNYYVREEYLLTLTLKNGKWFSNYYSFIDTWSKNIRVNQSPVAPANYDSLLQGLVKDSIFFIASWHYMKSMDSMHKRGCGLTFVSEGGIAYTIELLSKRAKRKFTISCPRAYYDTGCLPELRLPLSIVSKLLAIAGKGRLC
jgi:hypothetical protein